MAITEEPGLVCTPLSPGNTGKHAAEGISPGSCGWIQWIALDSLASCCCLANPPMQGWIGLRSAPQAPGSTDATFFLQLLLLLHYCLYDNDSLSLSLSVCSSLPSRRPLPSSSGFGCTLRSQRKLPLRRHSWCQHPLSLPLPPLRSFSRISLQSKVARLLAVRKCRNAIEGNKVMLCVGHIVSNPRVLCVVPSNVGLSTPLSVDILML